MTGGKSFGMRLLSWVHCFLIFEGVFVLAAGAGQIKGQEMAVFLFRGTALFIPLILTDIAIRRCKNLGLYCLLAVALTWGMKVLAGSLPAGGLTAFICLFRCYVRLKQGEEKSRMRNMPGFAGAKEDVKLRETPGLLDNPRPIHGLLLIFMYLGALPLHRHELSVLLLGLLAAEFCVCFAYMYLEQFWEFAGKNRHVANLPIKAMKKISAGILGMGMALLVLFMLPAAIYQKEPLEKLDFEMSENQNPVILETHREDSGPDYMMEELLRIKAAAKKTPPWMKTASKIVCMLMLLWISYLAIRMIFLAIKKAVETFSDDWEDEVVFLDRGEESSGKKGEERRKEKYWRSYGGKIRRLYKKLIKRRLKESIYGSETPAELEKRAGLHNEKEVYAIHELYEKARYAEEECTKEEVKRYVHIFSSFYR